MSTTLSLFLLVSLLLISIGLAGLVTRRTLVGMLICVELMLNGAGLAIVAAAKCTPASEVHGQLAALFVMGLAAAEATVVLAMILVVQRRFGKVTLDEVSIIRQNEAKGSH
ncbi:MAG: NADH-quinone oxidoreductase subunit NuoK [Deltaproteobacteria bacterium]|jgi:NADH-quinone oxidoreductase subunit K|nr:NADH-quinone oxidoreductase subunit NuoK [Deltaproteobacteria bacterium]